MAHTTFQFKFFRCLVLCLGLISGSTGTTQMIAMSLAEASDVSESEQALAMEVSDSGNGLTHPPIVDNTPKIRYPSTLTFEYLEDEIEQQGTANPTSADAIAHLNEPLGRSEKAEVSEGDSGQYIKRSGKHKKYKQYKKYKKYKQYKRGKVGKGYCRSIFQGTMIRGSEFTTVGSFSSDTLIQIFDDEASYQAGAAALQTIEYSEVTAQSLVVGHQLGSLSVVHEHVAESRELTFQYLSTTDSNYGDVVVNQSSSTGIITGTVDNDEEAYIVISDLRGGKNCRKAVQKCKGYKKGKGKSRKCGTVYVQQGFVSSGQSLQALSCRSETLLQVFEDEQRVTLTEFNTETLTWQRLSAQLVQSQTWRGVLGFARLQNQEQDGFVINLDVLDKPVTTYANAVYQIHANINGEWTQIYNTVGARLIDTRAGSMRLPVEIIALSDLIDVEGVDLTTVDLRASVQIRYDSQAEGRDQHISFNFSETSTNLLQVTQVTQLHQLYSSKIYCSRYSRYLWR